MYAPGVVGVWPCPAGAVPEGLHAQQAAAGAALLAEKLAMLSDTVTASIQFPWRCICGTASGTVRITSAHFPRTSSLYQENPCQ
jgi:hypothetical protein